MVVVAILVLAFIGAACLLVLLCYLIGAYVTLYAVLGVIAVAVVLGVVSEVFNRTAPADTTPLTLFDKVMLGIWGPMMVFAVGSVVLSELGLI